MVRSVGWGGAGGALVPAALASIIRARRGSWQFVLDRVHLVVRQPEVMPDFVDDDVVHEVFQRDTGFHPFVQQWSPEQRYRRWQFPRRPDRLLGEGTPLVETGQFP